MNFDGVGADVNRAGAGLKKFKGRRHNPQLLPLDIHVYSVNARIFGKEFGSGNSMAL